MHVPLSRVKTLEEMALSEVNVYYNMTDIIINYSWNFSKNNYFVELFYDFALKVNVQKGKVLYFPR